MTAAARPPRVLIVEPNLRDNGAIRSNLRLAYRWPSQGVRTDLFVVDPVGVPAEEFAPLPPGVRPVFPTRRPQALKRALVPGLARLLRLACAADVVIAGREMGLGVLVAWGAARLAGRPLIVMIRSAPAHSVGSHGPAWHRKPTLRALREAEAAVCISESLVSSVLDVGVARDAVHVVLNGVEIAEVREAAARPVSGVELPTGPGELVVGVGRLSRQKGFDVLIRAHARVVAAGHPHRLLLLGEGEQRPELEELVRRLGVENTVSMPGFVDNPLPVVASADLFCLSSRWEGFGQSLAEAMLLGVPTVATDCVAGPRELLADGEYGDLVPVDDEEALAAALRRHFDEPTRLRAAAERGRAWAERALDVDRAAAEMLEVVQRVAESAPRRRRPVRHAAGAPRTRRPVRSPLSERPGLRELVTEDLRTNHGHLFAPGFHALAVHRYGAWSRALPGPARLVAGVGHKVLQLLVRNVYGIEIPASVRIGRRVVIAHQSGIVVHPEVEIGDDCVLRHNVTLGARHGYPRPGRRVAPVLKRGVELAAGAAVIGPVTIGEWAKIGPNAVVLEDVPAGAVVLPAPVRVIEREPRPQPRLPG